MAVVTIPEGLLFGADCGWGQMRFDQVDESEADGSSDVRVRGRPRWTCSLVPPQRLKQGVEAQKWETMLLGLKGKTNVLAAYDPVRPQPAGGAWTALTTEVRRITKVSGGGAWNARASSTNSYTDGAVVTFSVDDNTSSVTCGLTSDPLVGSDPATIDFGLFYNGGALYAAENGTNTLISGTYTAPQEFAVLDNGTNIIYYVDGVVKRTVASSGLPMFASALVYSGQVLNLSFGPQNVWRETPYVLETATGNLTLNYGIDSITFRAPGETLGRSFSAGDKIQIGTGFGTSELVRIVTSGVVATLNGIKVVTVQFEPSARRFYSADTAITTTKPVAYFGSVGERVSWSYDGTGLQVRGYSFDGRERWR